SGMDRRHAGAAQGVGLQLCRRVVAAAAAIEASDRDQSRARAAREVSLVRSVRSEHAGAHGCGSEKTHRALSPLPYRIGYFSDNEVGWWSGALFLFYAQKPASNFTKQRWIATLRSFYHDDWRRFQRDFVPREGVGSWKALLQTEKPTRLRIGGHGIAAVERWTALVAQHYYALARRAIKKADPDAVFFGDRLPIYYDPAALP